MQTIYHDLHPHVILLGGWSEHKVGEFWIVVHSGGNAIHLQREYTAADTWGRHWLVRGMSLEKYNRFAGNMIQFVKDCTDYPDMPSEQTPADRRRQNAIRRAAEAEWAAILKNGGRRCGIG